MISVCLKPLSHWNATTGDKFANSSRLFRDKDKRYKHNFHVAVSLNRHLCDKESVTIWPVYAYTLAAQNTVIKLLMLILYVEDNTSMSSEEIHA